MRILLDYICAESVRQFNSEQIPNKFFIGNMEMDHSFVNKKIHIMYNRMLIATLLLPEELKQRVYENCRERNETI